LLASPVLELVYTTGLVRVNTDTPLQDCYPTGSGYTYTQKVHGRNKPMRELRYFVKWNACSEDENTWEPPESLENAQELIEGFHEENPDMPSTADVE